MTTARKAAWAYFDTSALVKRYVDEDGRQDVLRLLRQHRCITSAVHAVELRSAFRRRVTDDTLDATRMSDILARLTVDRQYWTQVAVGREVLLQAENLVAVQSLRTLDAIHIASAQVFATRMGTRSLLFVSADHRQTEVAARLGLTIRLIDSSM